MNPIYITKEQMPLAKSNQDGKLSATLVRNQPWNPSQIISLHEDILVFCGEYFGKKPLVEAHIQRYFSGRNRFSKKLFASDELLEVVGQGRHPLGDIPYTMDAALRREKEAYWDFHVDLDPEFYPLGDFHLYHASSRPRMLFVSFKENAFCEFIRTNLFTSDTKFKDSGIAAIFNPWTCAMLKNDACGAFYDRDGENVLAPPR